ncbi:FtsQ-type POTRA domain-containing protein [bacterium]|nr:FtsQ-type POTRA domain-containing protein [bacterium]
MMRKKVIDLRGKKPQPRVLPVKKVVARTRSTSPLHRKRIHKHTVLVLSFATVLVSLVGCVSIISYLPALTVTSVAVTGSDRVPERLVRAQAEASVYDSGYSFLSPSNIFLVSPERIAQSIRSNIPRLKEVSVSRTSLFAQALQVTVTERTAYARWCESIHECYLIDDQGFIFSRYSTADTIATNYSFWGGIDSSVPLGSTIDSARFSRAKEVLVLLTKYRYQPDRIIFSADAFDVVCDDFTIKASFDETPEMTVRNLELALSSPSMRSLRNIEYIDLRFGNRVYFKQRAAVPSVQPVATSTAVDTEE